MNAKNPVFIYAIISFVFSLIISGIMITFKINFKEASVISIIFAYFFLTFLIYQIFLINLDNIIGSFIIDEGGNRNLEYDIFFEYEYKIVGYISTLFSVIILPIYKDYLLSGYFSFFSKLWDGIKRRLKKFGILGIALTAYILIGLILFIIKGKDGYIIAKNFFMFLMNCLSFPNLITALMYLGAFFPLLSSEIRPYAKNIEQKVEQQCEIISYYLSRDQDRIVEAINDLKYIVVKYLKDNVSIKRKQYVLNLIDIVEKEKDNLEINELSLENEDLEIRINLKNFHHVLAEGIRNIKKGLNQIPRKLYVLHNIEKKVNNPYISRCKVIWFILIMILIVLFVYLVEIICIINGFYMFILRNVGISKIKASKTHYYALLFYSFSNFCLLYYSAIKMNSLTEQNIYGTKMSDTICLLEYAKRISGLINPLSLFTLDKSIGLMNKYRQNVIFLNNFGIPIVDNFFFNIDYTDYYLFYVIIKLIFIIFGFVTSCCFHSIKIKICKKEIEFKTNDKKNTNCCKKIYFDHVSRRSLLINKDD